MPYTLSLLLRFQEQENSASISKVQAKMNPGHGHPRGRSPAAGEIPYPGVPVRGSASGKPIMALLDLLGRRWALRIVWELRHGPLVFRVLQERCEGMSSSVLNQRLRELRGAGIIDAGDGGYGLTQEGRRLLDAYAPINAWAERWAARVQRPA
jgi:DNA-binding HxlR family transcriptional regulator